LSSTNFSKVGCGSPACSGSSLGSNPDTSQKYKAKAWPTSPSSPPKKTIPKFCFKSFRKYKLSTKFCQFFLFLLLPLCFLYSQFKFISFALSFSLKREKGFLLKQIFFCFSFVLFVLKTRHSAYYSLITHHYLFFCEKLKKRYQFPTDLWW
jgi:hypothetical protein